MKKRLITLLLVLVMVVPMLVACGDSTSTTEQWGEWVVTTPATCTEPGVKTRTSLTDSSVTQTAVILATGHDWDDGVVTKEATTTSNGEITYTCGNCGATTTEIIEKLPDDQYNAENIPADGEGVFVVALFERYCSSARLEILLNDFKVYCEENDIDYEYIGYRTYDGEALTVADFSCGVMADGDIDVVIGGGNNINSNSTAPTIEGGEYSNLSSIMIEKSDAVTIYVTDGETGTDITRRHLLTSEDSVALAFWDYLTTSKAIAILADEDMGASYEGYTDWVVVTPATCTTAGEETRTKLDDGTVETREIPALGHDWDEGVVTLEPTTTSTGEITYTCQREGCTATYTEEIPMLSATAQTTFVLGVYTKYMSEEKAITLINAFKAYCQAEGIDYTSISYTLFDSSLNTDGLENAVTADGNIDIVLGAGKAYDATYVAVLDSQTIYFSGGSSDATRRHVKITYGDLSDAFWSYIQSDEGVAVLSADTEPEVQSTFILGIYGKYMSEEKAITLVNAFKAYCADNNIAYTSITYKFYNSTDYNNNATTVAGVKEDGNIDVFLGGGGNITDAGNLDEYLDSIADQSIYYNDNTATNKKHVKLTAGALSDAFWTYIQTDEAKAILSAETEPDVTAPTPV